MSAMRLSQRAVSIASLLVTVLFGWGFAGIGSKANADDERLQWKWTPGQQFEVDMVQQMEADTNYTGKSIKLRVDITLNLGWKVESVLGDPPAGIVRQSVRRIRATISDGQSTPKSYDSDAKRNPVDLSGAFDRFKDLELRMQIEPDGKIVSVEFPPAAKEALQKNGVPGVDFGQMLRQSMLTFPSAAVAAGSSWRGSLESPIPNGKLKLATTYLHGGEVDWEDKKLVQITHTSILDLDADQGESKLAVKEHEQTGTILFDAAAGRIVSSKTNQRLKTQSRLRETVIDTTTRSSLEMTITNSGM